MSADRFFPDGWCEFAIFCIVIAFTKQFSKTMATTHLNKSLSLYKLLLNNLWSGHLY